VRIQPRIPGSTRGRVVLAVVLPLVLLGLVLGAARWVAALPSDAVCRADGVVMTKVEFGQRVKMLGALYGITARPGAQQQEQFRRDAAKMIAVATVIDHRAQDRKIEASDQDAHAVLDKMIAELNPPGKDSFIQLLADTGASQNDVLDEIKRQLRSSRLVRQIVEAPVGQLTEADFRAYYQQHAADLATPEQRHLRNIVVHTRDEADQVAQRARGGTDFAALVQENTLDRATRDSQGDLGLVARSQLEPGYGQAAFAAPVGAIFGPVETSSGWNVGRVDEIRPAVPRTYEQARDEVVRTVRASRTADTWNAWLTTQIEAADVRYADEYQPADPTAPPALPSGGPAGSGPVTGPPSPSQPESPR
jgi:parvulin-like peptidyl-prolyl isomerase